MGYDHNATPADNTREITSELLTTYYNSISVMSQIRLKNPWLNETAEERLREELESVSDSLAYFIAELNTLATSVDQATIEVDVELDENLEPKEHTSEEDSFFARRKLLIEESIVTQFDGSLNKAADAAGVSPDTLKRVRDNDNHGRSKTLEKIAKALDIDMMYLSLEE